MTREALFENTSTARIPFPAYCKGNVTVQILIRMTRECFESKLCKYHSLTICLLNAAPWYFAQFNPPNRLHEMFQWFRRIQLRSIYLHYIFINQCKLTYLHQTSMCIVMHLFVYGLNLMNTIGHEANNMCCAFLTAQA